MSGVRPIRPVDAEGEESVSGETSARRQAAAMDEITTTLAHEVSQPLTAMMANAEVARSLLDMESPDLADIGRLLDEISAQGELAAALLRRARDLLRTTPRGSACFSVVDAVSGVVPVVRLRLHTANIEFSVHVGQGDPRIWGDFVQIQQIVLNLIQNAYQALHDWPGPRRIRVDVTPRSAMVELCVADTGPGPSNQVVENLFEPFVTTKEGGLGLGLAICRSIVHAHGGSIVVRPGTDWATSFVVALPSASNEVR